MKCTRLNRWVPEREDVLIPIHSGNKGTVPTLSLDLELSPLLSTTLGLDHDGADIAIGTGGIGGSAIPTGRRKLGAILGDRVLTGCNCVLHPGCLVGAGTQLYPGVQLRSGVHPANSIIKLRQELEIVERREN